MKLDANVIQMIRKCESDPEARDKLFWLLVEQYTEVVMVAFLAMFHPYTCPMHPDIEVSTEIYNKVMGFARTNKIEGIKALRAATGCGLKEAKDMVEYFVEQEALKLVKEVG